MTISFVGPSSYTVQATMPSTTDHEIDSVVTVPGVANATPFASGMLAVELWLLDRPYRGGSTGSGYQIGADTLTSGLGVGGVLGAQTIDLSASQNRIPFGTYHVALLLIDMSSGTRVVDDWINYAGVTTLSTAASHGDESNGGDDDSDTGGGSSNDSNQGSSGNDHDTFSPNGGATTIVALSGPDTVTGDTFGDWVVLANSTVLFNSNGADTIFGSSSNATINAAGAPLYFGASGAALFAAQGTAATLVGGGAETVMAGAANVLAFGGTGPMMFEAGSGASTVVGGGSATIIGGATGLLYFGGGPTDYVGGTGIDTVVGGGGALTATGGATATLIFTGTAGGALVGTGAGAATVVGFGVGDRLSATGSAAQLIEAAAGSETIDGTQSSGSDAFFAFADGDVVEAGSGAVAIASLYGTQTLVGGSGSALLEISDSGAARAITIEDFAAGRDYVSLAYYPQGMAAAALAGAVSTGGNEVLTLSDGATVTFVGTTNLTASSFV